MLKYVIKKFKLYIYYFFGDKNSKAYIIFQKKKWPINNNKLNQGVALVDFFQNYPFIHLWSYLVNYLSQKKSLKINYFYFPLYNNFITKIKYHKNYLKAIYNSFNVRCGIDEINIQTDSKIEYFAKKKFKKIKTKKNLLNFKYKNILLGDLVYDSYLRANFKCTVELNDVKLFNLFRRSIYIFEEIEKYIKNNNVKFIIPSHIQYVQYALIVRIACWHNIKVIKLHSKDWGNTKFRLTLIDREQPHENGNEYYNYRKIFGKLKNKKQKRLIGKKILLNRILGKKDKTISYMKENEYKIHYNNKYLNQFAEKKIAVVFCHCFFDAPHKYRTMIFEDFYEQIKFLSKIAKSRKDLIWIFKRHPNEISENDNVYLNAFQNNENIYYIKDELNNYDLLKLNIQFGITNHGTVGHEFAYLNIPIINTGDNPHINYNFNFHAKNRKEIVKWIDFILKNRKKINLKKSRIEEFAYMHYYYYKNLYGEVDFKLDKYLATKDYHYNTTSKIFNYYTKNDSKFDSLAKKYINNFFIKNKL
jgi:hypothetical protein